MLINETNVKCNGFNNSLGYNMHGTNVVNEIKAVVLSNSLRY